jgi:hypothetical protein
MSHKGLHKFYMDLVFNLLRPTLGNQRVYPQTNPVRLIGVVTGGGRRIWPATSGLVGGLPKNKLAPWRCDRAKGAGGLGKADGIDRFSMCKESYICRPQQIRA